jgi:hypothetical protein
VPLHRLSQHRAGGPSGGKRLRPTRGIQPRFHLTQRFLRERGDS